MRHFYRAFVIVLVVAGATVSEAQYVTNNTDFPGPGWKLRLDNGDQPSFADDGLTLDCLKIDDFTNSVPLPVGDTTDVDTDFEFTATFNLNEDLDGMGSAELGITDEGGGDYQIEINSFDLKGSMDGDTFELKENQPGTGGETVVPQGNGQFKIHSFFDIFVDLSIDGGTFELGKTPNGSASRLELSPSGTPEPMTLGLSLAGIGIAVRRRRVGNGRR